MFQVGNEQQQPVEDVDVADASVEVEGEQIQLRIELADAFLHAFRDDVVGDAPEGLQADDVVYAVSGNEAISPGSNHPSPNWALSDRISEAAEASSKTLPKGRK